MSKLAWNFREIWEERANVEKNLTEYYTKIGNMFEDNVKKI